MALLISTPFGNNSSAQQPKASYQDGHRSPLMAEISYSDGTHRQVWILGYWDYDPSWYTPYTFKAIGPGGSEVELWLDTISSISDISGKQATFHMKNGTSQRLGLKMEPLVGFALTDDTGAKEMLRLPNVKSVKFLTPPRTDKDKNVMLDQWHYSPYTGEKLGSTP